jgi:predicted SAM-dependent methyltransferase
MKLNFGCGDHIIDGWVNADKEDTNFEGGETYVSLPHGLTLPWDDDTFDQVLMAHVMEHIPLDGDLTAADQKARGMDPIITVQQVLAEIYRVMKPGGSCLIIGPDMKKYLNFFFNMYSMPELNSRGEVHRIGQFWVMDGLMREGAVEEWIAEYVDPSRVNTRRHDVGISSTDDPEKDFSLSEVEELITILCEAIFGNFVLENDIHFGQSDHRWNCYEDRLFNFVSEVFPSVERTPWPEGVGDFRQGENEELPPSGMGFDGFDWPDRDEVVANARCPNPECEKRRPEWWPPAKGRGRVCDVCYHDMNWDIHDVWRQWRNAEGDAVWRDGNGLKWPTRSWFEFCCAVLATK